MGVDNTKARLLRIIEELSQISANQAEILDYLKQENEELSRTNQYLAEKVEDLKKELDGLGYTE